MKYQWDVTDGQGSFLKNIVNHAKKLISGNSFFLNTDIELAYDIDLDNTGSGTQCVIGQRLAKDRFFNIFKNIGHHFANIFHTNDKKGKQQCKEAPTKNLVAIYAKVGKRDAISYYYSCEI